MSFAFVQTIQQIMISQIEFTLHPHRIKRNSCVKIILSIGFSHSKKEEIDISYASECSSERFDFSIERFSRSVRASIVKIIKYGFVMSFNSSGYCSKRRKLSSVYSVVPLSQFCKSYPFGFCLMINCS